MAKATVDFGFDGIGHVLSDRQLAVPIYQRSYAWKDEQLDDFISDLRNAFNSDPREYFLGTVVLSLEGEEGRETIIDGQQRLATTSIFLAAMRDYFEANGEEKRAEQIQHRYLGSYDDDLDADVPKLQLNADDDGFFRGWIVENDEETISARESHDLISAAYFKLYAFVEEIASNAGASWVSRLREWRLFIEGDVRVIFVLVAKESDAFLIFETLNDRGADLTVADLLKNYLFGRAGTSKLDAVRENWLVALSSFDLHVDSFVTFIRHFWSSKYGAVRERELYKKIKEGVTNSPQATKFASELEKASSVYAALLNPASSYWNEWGTSTRHNLETLNRLALEQNRPMLLAAAQHLSKAEMKKVLRFTVAWSVRGLVVGGIGGGATETAYCKAAVKIRSGDIKTAAELRTELGSIIPSDDEFKKAFATVRVTKYSLSRYYLSALERMEVGVDEPELVPNGNEEQVNLEHILPKKATDTVWPTFNDEQRRTYLDRLGNHALMKKSTNDDIANKGFADKRAALKASDIRLTKEVGKLADWTPAEVDKRQERLALLAVKTWSA